MCNFKRLQKTAHGITRRCEHCRRIYVSFGTTVLAFAKEDFESFCARIARIWEGEASGACCNKRRYYIPTPHSTITLRYSPREIQHLHALLQKTAAVLKMEQRFAFNHN